MEYALLLTLPAALGAIGRGLAGHVRAVRPRRVRPRSVRLSAQSLAAYALGLPAFVLVKVLAPGFFARGDTATPVKIGVAAVALNLALNFAFMLPLQAHRPGAGHQPAADVQRRLARRGSCAGAASCGSTRNCRHRVPRMAASAASMALVLCGAAPAVRRRGRTAS